MGSAVDLLLDKAVKNALRVSTTVAPSVRRWFERIKGVPGSQRLLRRIADVPEGGAEQLEDYLAEAECILLFIGLGFAVEIEPAGRKGPDLKVSRDGREAFVEVTRLRKTHEGPGMVSDGEALQVYGDSERDVRRSFEKLSAKLPQVKQGNSIIALWNGDGSVEELEVREAVNDLRDDASAGITPLPTGLCFVLYRSGWWGPWPDTDLHCYPFKEDDENPLHDWMQEMQSAGAYGPVMTALSGA